MHTHLHRFALAVLVLCGVLGAAAAGWPDANDVAGQDLRSSVWPVAIQHRQFMLGLLSAMLVVSTLLPALRLPALVVVVAARGRAVAGVLMDGARVVRCDADEGQPALGEVAAGLLGGGFAAHDVAL